MISVAQLHSEYVANTVEEPAAAAEVSPKLDPSDETQQQHHPQEEEEAVGHLQERVAQFDARTRIMQDDWYLKFAEMRRGSFLPRKVAVQEDGPENNADDNEKGVANWENRPLTSIRFLHWIGFDPRSALPPPSEQITHALAFLCYDFFGRIVEKVRERKTI
jgi:hypothetical protein